jgi:hypothetical protein
MEAIGKLVTGLSLVLVSTIVGGFVFMKLWSYFIITTFDVSPLTLIQAIGVAFVFSHLKAKIKKSDIDEKLEFSDTVVLLMTSIIYNFLYLLLGYIISLFM